MNDQATLWQKQKSSAITAMFGLSLITGIVIAALSPHNAASGMPLGIQLVANVLLFVLGFRWLGADSAERDIRRPMWLNVGIVLLAVVGIVNLFIGFAQRGHGSALAGVR